MHVAFRVDASDSIGTGHAMRCITLANALRDAGASCVFMCRQIGRIGSNITKQGHELRLLPTNIAQQISDGSPYATWLGTDWRQDAADTVASLAGKADWLVVDHYAIDARWEAELRPHTRRILAIDDLANRSHDADLLLDQTLDRVAVDYDPWLSAGVTRLVGSRYALLRPDFFRLRDASLLRRMDGRLNSILVTLGGADVGNATSRMLTGLAAVSELMANAVVDVVLGANASSTSEVRQIAATLPFACSIELGVNDMAHRMMAADMSLGAIGSTAWERCCLGVPSVAVVLADNQRNAAAALSDHGAAVVLELDNDLEKNVSTSCSLLAKNPGMLRSLSQRASELVDGRGTMRVVERMLEGI